ncbi:MAG: type I pantothenate kinase, partial [Candidatus Dormibacteraceae bacterium]
AQESAIEEWYVQRFLTFRHTAFQDPNSYFHRFHTLSDLEATHTAHQIWQEINGPNLRQNIEPTRDRARLILRKQADHSIQEILLRRI